MRGQRRLFRLSFLLGFLLISVPVYASEEVRLVGSEIRETLMDKTAISTDPDWPYRQYFQSDFTTIYAETGKRSSLGKWKTGNDLYCSLWAAADWECYQLWKTGKGIVWIAELNAVRYPARLVDGQQLLEK